MKNIIQTILITIIILSFIIGVPFSINETFKYTHRQEIYKALECLDEYDFDVETENELRKLISKVAEDTSYTILVEYQSNGVAVSVRRGGDYNCSYTKYFYE